MAPTNDSTAPPTPTPPPAPSLADLYGPQGNLVAAPPTTPAGISQHQGAGGSWDEGSVPDESQRTQLENTGALPKARTTTQAASADIKKTGAVVQKVIDTPALKSVASQIPGYDEAMSAAHESAAWLKAHGHEKAANALSAYLGAESGADEFASAMTSPKNMMMLYSLGKLKTAGAGGEVLDRLISAKFSYDSIKDAYDNVPGVQKAIDGGDYETAARLITNAAGGFALGVSAAHGAVSGVNGGEAPEADTIRQRAADAQSTTPVAGAGVPDEQSTLKIPKTEKAPAATTPPTHIDMSDLGATTVDRRGSFQFGRTKGTSFGDTVNTTFDVLRQHEAARPEPEIKTEGPEWDRTHSAYVDGKKVGSVGYKVDPDGRAQIYGSNVNPEFRGKGIGQKLYQSAIDEAEENGADRITSDSTNTTPDANRVWDKLKEKGVPVEDITHPNGKPGYQITFNPKPVDLSDLGSEEAGDTPDHLLTGERQSELPEPYSVRVGTEDGMEREEHVDAFSHKDALKQAQKQFPDAREWSVHQIGQRTPSTEYSVPSGKLLSMPELISGKTPEYTMNHEIGHAMIGQKEGLTQEGVLRHTHPDLSRRATARASVRWSGQDLFDTVTRTIKPEKRTSVVNMMMGGIAADEVFNDTPRAANHNFDYDRHGSDAQQAYDILKEAGFKHEEILDVLHKSIDANKEYLQRPEVSGIVKENAGVREPKLSKHFHMSSERLTQMHAEAQRRMGNEISDNGTTGAGNAQNGEANVASGKGTVSGADGEVGPAKVTTHEVNPEDEGDESFNFGANAGKYHPDLQKVADKYGVSNDPTGVKNGASFIAPDGKFIHLGTTEHPDAIRWAGAGNREDFLDQTGAVRVRFNARDKAGPTTHISVPPQGVTEAEIPAIRQAIAQAGRNGNVVMERSDITPETRDTLSMSQDFPRGADTEEYLRRIQAHPDQHLQTAEVNPEDEGDTSFNFGANEKSPTADNSESKRTAASPESKGTPTNEAAESAQRYNAAKGQPQINHEAPPLNEGRAQALAAEMDTHAHEPNTPAVKKAYKSLIADVKEQWNHAQKDMGIKFEPSEKDPYTSYDEVKKDVEDNKHMSIYTGGNPLPEDHPLAQVDPKTGLTYNTMLRGVHDLYGHIAGNNDFSEQGEAGATNAHRQMMSPASVPALLNETEGQVSQYFHGKEKGGFPPQNATTVPENFVKDWHQTAGERAAKEEAGGIDPRTGTSATEGVGSEILPERRQALDHAPTPADFKAFYEANRDVLDKNPDLKVGWDNNSKVPGGHEINIGIVGDDAARLAKKLDQTSAFDIGKGEVIPTKGSGLRTEFPNYSLEERIKDAKGEPLSNVKDFEHLSKDFYDHLEPDERDYLKGNKTLQRNAMSQYHKIDPSVAETTNAMASGAALGGWWQRYMDVFHGLIGEDGKAVGVKPEGIPLYHATTHDFENFDPMVNGATGDFGTHLGSVDQAHGRISGNLSDTLTRMLGTGPNVRPVYADIKNPVRLQDNGDFLPHHVAKQLQAQGIITDAERMAIADKKGYIEPEKLRDLLESKGYDGAVYLNRAEGIPLNKWVGAPSEWTDAQFKKNVPEAHDSYIALRPEQIQPKYPAEQIASTIGPAHSEVLKQWHAAVSGNKSVEDANNLAWHSYADWLDAGKPTDRTSINNIVKQNAAQPEGSPKKGNAAISDTLDKNGKILSEGLDTSKLFKLVNSPEMRGERPFSNDAFNEKTPNALVAKTEGARKIPSMGATVAGKGNLNRLVIDAHIRDFYGHQNSGGPAAQYIADSVHLRQAAEALGLKGGEGQEQLWGTVLGLKQLLKTGLTPEEAAGKLNSDVINQIGKDYAEVIANDPEITKPGGLLDRLKEKYGVGSGSAGVGEANRKASASRAGQAESRSSQTPVDQTQLAKTAERIKGQISESKIKKPAVAVPAEEVPATPKKAIPAEDPRLAELRAADKAARDKRAAAMKKGIAGLSKPGTK